MMHKKENNRQRAERMKLNRAVRQVMRRRAGLTLRDREVYRHPIKEPNPWADFIKRESCFHSDEVYNLDVAATLFLAPRIRLLIKGGFEQCGATPAIQSIDGKTAHESWRAILKKIQFAFDTLESIVDDTGLYDWDRVTSEQREKIDEGLALFGKYMLYLCV